ncbi:MAG: PASTA domain-containing protein [Saprospiraceae bacterium]|nr:PASTA domain-containing protein [Saprospiraceae bacterium]
MLSVLNFLELPYFGSADGEMAVVMAQSDSLIIDNRRLPEDKVPSVIGMGLRDALYALENRGLRVRISGVGKVVTQSIMPGTRARGQTVSIRLN